TASDFEPRGTTPLYDAIGRSVTLAQGRACTPDGSNEQPLVVVLTDGLENASHEYTHAQIFDLIKAKESAGWIFTYLGANQDAYAVGGAIGINAGATQNYVADAQ